MSNQTIEWLRGLAAKGGKGVVNNIDARSLGRIADEYDALAKALRDTLCELTACADQLAARGLKGHEGDSVSRAQIAARQVLSLVGGARHD
jgi:hypothetical protein